ncbi:MAG TPA: CHASE3 domain-containing protein, partial [Rhodanobacteraceae bacterium]|nr:CHASE3 domain-containing protein [Rhodanobacteraceae bacterium]
MRWRMAALLLAVVVSVVLPYMVTRSTTESALNARAWVAHSAEVRATVYQLTYRLRDMEAASYSLLRGVDSEEMQRRVAEAQAQVGPLLKELRDLTLDNADQQARLGALSTVVTRRMQYMDRAVQRQAAGDKAAAYQALADASNLFRYRDIADAMVAAEADLLASRTAVAEHRARISRRVLLGTTVAQLLLLGIVVVVSERAIARRFLAERESQQAVARAQRIVQTVREPMA